MEIALVIGAVLIVLALIWAGTAIYGFRKVAKMQESIGRRIGSTRNTDFFADFDSPEPKRVRGRRLR